MPHIANNHKWIYTLLMKYAFIAAVLSCLSYSTCLAWDGYNSDTADLVEIIPDSVPNIGATVDVRNYETDENTPCIVESVVRNRRTIEVIVRDPGGKRHILVMEGR